MWPSTSSSRRRRGTGGPTFARSSTRFGNRLRRRRVLLRVADGRGRAQAHRRGRHRGRAAPEGGPRSSTSTRVSRADRLATALAARNPPCSRCRSRSLARPIADASAPARAALEPRDRSLRLVPRAPLEDAGLVQASDVDRRARRRVPRGPLQRRRGRRVGAVLPGERERHHRGLRLQPKLAAHRLRRDDARKASAIVRSAAPV
jgi:hypothetical protein